MSGGSLTASNWFRIAPLRPRLGGHVRVHRHRYRGEVWYVVEDRAGGRFHRFNGAAYRIIAALDGRRTMQEIWDALAAELHEHSPSQDDVLRLLGQLNAADLIVTEASIDSAELFTRQARQQRQRTWSKIGNPLALRLPLWDPDVALGRVHALLGGVPGWAWTLLWLAAVVPALALLPTHWRELTENFNDRLLATGNLAILALAFVVLKGLHELGHGWSVKSRGGEVHEMGLMLLLFYPVPYVDASGASAFARKGDRMRVGAAGMRVELWVAALAFLAWLALEPGFARSLAYNMMVVGSVTTVVFNANPLLRYDGYYILADAVEVPNLAQRANAWWVHLLRRHGFGITTDPAPHATPAERRWFAGYAPLALAYRLFVTLSIAWFIGQQYFFIGVLLAAWSVASGIVWPLARGVVRLSADPQATSRAGRVVAVALGLPLLALLLAFTVPLPHHTRAHGVVALPDEAVLRAGGDGFVQRVAAANGEQLVPGALVMLTDAPELRADIRVQQARVAEAQARLDSAWGTNPAAAGRLEEDLRRENATLARLEDQLGHLAVRADAGGQLLLRQAGDWPGRHLRKGDALGWVVGRERPLLKVVVPQHQADLVRASTGRVGVRLAQRFGTELQGRVLREVPLASNELPSSALGQQGGGDFTVDPRDEKGVTALESLFQFEVALDDTAPLQYLGSRAWVSFEHPAEPLGWRLWRNARRALLSHFHV